MWLLGLELRTFGRAVSGLICRVISPAPIILEVGKYTYVMDLLFWFGLVWFGLVWFGLF